MSSETTISSLAAIPALGVAAQWLGWRTRLPSILFLLLTGFLAGPLTGLLDPDTLFGDLLTPLVNMSVALVLYEGGLSLRRHQVASVEPVLHKLLLYGLPVTWLAATALGVFVLGLNPGVALLIGAVLTVSGPTVVGPLLETVRPTRRVRSVLQWEGTLIDPLGAALGVLVFGALMTHQNIDDTGRALVQYGGILVLGVAAGWAGASVLLGIMSRLWLPDSLHNGVTLALVLAVYGACEQIVPESGLFAATMMGMTLSNQKSVEVRHLVHFSETVRVLLVGSLFVVLAAREPVELLVAQLRLETVLYVAGLVLVIRPVVVALATWTSVLDWRERLFVAAMNPRGIVAAASASAFGLKLLENGHPDASQVIPVVFVVIVSTVVIYGLGCLPLAQALGLRQPEPQGCLILGARDMPRLIAHALLDAGVKVLLVDLDPLRAQKAREEGLPVLAESVFTEEGLRMGALDGLGHAVALSASPELNSLFLLRFTDDFPSSHRYLLAEDHPQPRPGRVLFGEGATFAEMDRRVKEGATVRRVPATQTLPLGALPLFLLGPEGQVQPVAAEAPPAPRAGQSLLVLG